MELAEGVNRSLFQCNLEICQHKGSLHWSEAQAVLHHSVPPVQLHHSHTPAQREHKPLRQPHHRFFSLTKHSRVPHQTYSSVLHTHSQHNNGADMLLPDQPPEIIQCFLQGSLTGNELLWGVVTLKKGQAEELKWIITCFSWMHTGA